MSPNWLLIWTVALSCGLITFSLMRSRVRSLLHYLPSLTVAVILIFSYYRDQETAGYYAGSVWFLVIFLPGVASQSAQSLLASRRFTSAFFVSWLAWLLHPFGGTRDQPRLVHALAQLNNGNDEKAFRSLESLRQSNSASGRAAFVITTRLRGEWQNFLSSIAASPKSEKLLHDALFMNIYLQALGETGQTERLLYEFVRLIQNRKPACSGLMLNISRMKVAAFCGRPELVAMLLDGPLGHLDLATQRFWLATAIQAAGRESVAQPIFQELQSDPDRQIAIAAERRLHTALRIHQPLPGNFESEVLVGIEGALQHESRYALINAPAAVPPVATRGLVAILVCVFVAEMFNGATGRIVWNSTSLSIQEKAQLLIANSSNNENLFDMGALVLPTGSFPDPQWRVFRAAFLHFGILHLLMNLAGLIIFGPRLEEAWGSVLTCTAYLSCAVGSISLMTLLPLGATAAEPYVLAGASGGVMGLIGCLLGYLGWGQLVRRNRLVAKEFNLLFTIVMVQLVFDQYTPEVSSECHLLGLAIGIAFGLSVGCGQHQFGKRLAHSN